MLSTQSRFPIEVRTGWVHYSPALRYHASRQVQSRLAPYAPQIRSVLVRIADDEPPHTTRRRCDIEVNTAGANRITTSSTGDDLFALVDRALDDVVEELRVRSMPDRQRERERRIA